MIGSIINAIGNILNAGSNRLEIEHLKDAIRQLEAHKEHTQAALAEVRRTLHDHERRLLYLEISSESPGNRRQIDASRARHRPGQLARRMLKIARHLRQLGRIA